MLVDAGRGMSLDKAARLHNADEDDVLRWLQRFSERGLASLPAAPAERMRRGITVAAMTAGAIVLTAVPVLAQFGAELPEATVETDVLAALFNAFIGWRIGRAITIFRQEASHAKLGPYDQRLGVLGEGVGTTTELGFRRLFHNAGFFLELVLGSIGPAINHANFSHHRPLERRVRTLGAGVGGALALLVVGATTFTPDTWWAGVSTGQPVLDLATNLWASDTVTGVFVRSIVAGALLTEVLPEAFVWVYKFFATPVDPQLVAEAEKKTVAAVVGTHGALRPGRSANDWARRPPRHVRAAIWLISTLLPGPAATGVLRAWATRYDDLQRIREQRGEARRTGEKVVRSARKASRSPALSNGWERETGESALRRPALIEAALEHRVTRTQVLRLRGGWWDPQSMVGAVDPSFTGGWTVGVRSAIPLFVAITVFPWHVLPAPFGSVPERIGPVSSALGFLAVAYFAIRAVQVGRKVYAQQRAIQRGEMEEPERTSLRDRLRPVRELKRKVARGGELARGVYAEHHAKRVDLMLNAAARSHMRAARAGHTAQALRDAADAPRAAAPAPAAARKPLGTSPTAAEIRDALESGNRPLFQRHELDALTRSITPGRQARREYFRAAFSPREFTRLLADSRRLLRTVFWRGQGTPIDLPGRGTRRLFLHEIVPGTAPRIEGRELSAGHYLTDGELHVFFEREDVDGLVHELLEAVVLPAHRPGLSASDYHALATLVTIGLRDHLLAEHFLRDLRSMRRTTLRGLVAWTPTLEQLTDKHAGDRGLAELELALAYAIRAAAEALLPQERPIRGDERRSAPEGLTVQLLAKRWDAWSTSSSRPRFVGAARYLGLVPDDGPAPASARRENLSYRRDVVAGNKLLLEDEAAVHVVVSRPVGPKLLREVARILDRGQGRATIAGRDARTDVAPWEREAELRVRLAAVGLELESVISAANDPDAYEREADEWGLPGARTAYLPGARTAYVAIAKVARDAQPRPRRRLGRRLAFVAATMAGLLAAVPGPASAETIAATLTPTPTPTPAPTPLDLGPVLWAAAAVAGVVVAALAIRRSAPRRWNDLVHPRRALRRGRADRQLLDPAPAPRVRRPGLPSMLAVSAAVIGLTGTVWSTIDAPPAIPMGTYEKLLPLATGAVAGVVAWRWSLNRNDLRNTTGDPERSRQNRVHAWVTGSSIAALTFAQGWLVQAPNLWPGLGAAAHAIQWFSFVGIAGLSVFAQRHVLNHHDRVRRAGWLAVVAGVVAGVSLFAFHAPNPSAGTVGALVSGFALQAAIGVTHEVAHNVLVTRSTRRARADVRERKRRGRTVEHLSVLQQRAPEARDVAEIQEDADRTQFVRDSDVSAPYLRIRVRNPLQYLTAYVAVWGAAFVAPGNGMVLAGAIALLAVTNHGIVRWRDKREPRAYPDRDVLVGHGVPFVQARRALEALGELVPEYRKLRAALAGFGSDWLAVSGFGGRDVLVLPPLRLVQPTSGPLREKQKAALEAWWKRTFAAHDGDRMNRELLDLGFETLREELGAGDPRVVAIRDALALLPRLEERHGRDQLLELLTAMPDELRDLAIERYERYGEFLEGERGVATGPHLAAVNFAIVRNDARHRQALRAPLDHRGNEFGAAAHRLPGRADFFGTEGELVGAEAEFHAQQTIAAARRAGTRLFAEDPAQALSFHSSWRDFPQAWADANAVDRAQLAWNLAAAARRQQARVSRAGSIAALGTVIEQADLAATRATEAAADDLRALGARIGGEVARLQQSQLGPVQSGKKGRWRKRLHQRLALQGLPSSKRVARWRESQSFGITLIRLALFTGTIGIAVAVYWTPVRLVNATGLFTATALGLVLGAAIQFVAPVWGRFSPRRVNAVMSLGLMASVAAFATVANPFAQLAVAAVLGGFAAMGWLQLNLAHALVANWVEASRNREADAPAFSSRPGRWFVARLDAALVLVVLLGLSGTLRLQSMLGELIAGEHAASYAVGAIAAVPFIAAFAIALWFLLPHKVKGMDDTRKTWRERVRDGVETLKDPFARVLAAAFGFSGLTYGVVDSRFRETMDVERGAEEWIGLTDWNFLLAGALGFVFGNVLAQRAGFAAKVGGYAAAGSGAVALVGGLFASGWLDLYTAHVLIEIGTTLLTIGVGTIVNDRLSLTRAAQVYALATLAKFAGQFLGALSGEWLDETFGWYAVGAGTLVAGTLGLPPLFILAKRYLLDSPPAKLVRRLRKALARTVFVTRPDAFLSPPENNVPVGYAEGRIKAFQKVWGRAGATVALTRGDAAGLRAAGFPAGTVLPVSGTDAVAVLHDALERRVATAAGRGEPIERVVALVGPEDLDLLQRTQEWVPAGTRPTTFVVKGHETSDALVENAMFGVHGSEGRDALVSRMLGEPRFPWLRGMFTGPGGARRAAAAVTWLAGGALIVTALVTRDPALASAATILPVGLLRPRGARTPASRPTVRRFLRGLAASLAGAALLVLPVLGSASRADAVPVIDRPATGGADAGARRASSRKPRLFVDIDGVIALTQRVSSRRPLPRLVTHLKLDEYTIGAGATADVRIGAEPAGRANDAKLWWRAGAWYIGDARVGHRTKLNGRLITGATRVARGRRARDRRSSLAPRRRRGRSCVRRRRGIDGSPGRAWQRARARRYRRAVRAAPAARVAGVRRHRPQLHPGRDCGAALQARRALRPRVGDGLARPGEPVHAPGGAARRARGGRLRRGGNRARRGMEDRGHRRVRARRAARLARRSPQRRDGALGGAARRRLSREGRTGTRDRRRACRGADRVGARAAQGVGPVVPARRGAAGERRSDRHRAGDPRCRAGIGSDHPAGRVPAPARAGGRAAPRPAAAPCATRCVAEPLGARGLRAR